jgi:hypothetical protein
MFAARPLIEQKLKQGLQSVKRFCEKEKSNPMFSNISWLEYLTFIAVSALIYYVFVLVTYYRYDLLQTIKAKQPASVNTLNFTADSIHQSGSPVIGEDFQSKMMEVSQSQIVQSLIDEVRAYLEEARRDETSKEVLLQCLSLIAGKYPSLANSEYRNSIDQFLINEAEANCAVLLSEDEVSGVWSGA